MGGAALSRPPFDTVCHADTVDQGRICTRRAKQTISTVVIPHYGRDMRRFTWTRRPPSAGCTTWTWRCRMSASWAKSAMLCGSFSPMLPCFCATWTRVAATKGSFEIKRHTQLPRASAWPDWLTTKTRQPRKVSLGIMEDAADAVPWSKPTIDAHWQSQVDAIGSLLFNRRAVHLDEFRRYIEALPDASAKAMTYYGKCACPVQHAAWCHVHCVCSPAGAAALLQCLLRNGTITEVEVDALLNGRDNVTASPCFAMGDHVRVRPYVATGLSLVRKPHLRTPGYLFGARGVVVGLLGSFREGASVHDAMRSLLMCRAQSARVEPECCSGTASRAWNGARSCPNWCSGDSALHRRATAAIPRALSHG